MMQVPCNLLKHSWALQKFRFVVRLNGNSSVGSRKKLGGGQKERFLYVIATSWREFAFAPEKRGSFETSAPSRHDFVFALIYDAKN
jgi:hypothetical protein